MSPFRATLLGLATAALVLGPAAHAIPKQTALQILGEQVLKPSSSNDEVCAWMTPAPLAAGIIETLDGDVAVNIAALSGNRQWFVYVDLEPCALIDDTHHDPASGSRHLVAVHPHRAVAVRHDRVEITVGVEVRQEQAAAHLDVGRDHVRPLEAARPVVQEQPVAFSVRRPVRAQRRRDRALPGRDSREAYTL